jgi:uncharacterized protein YndB with AHSA1/START domain
MSASQPDEISMSIEIDAPADAAWTACTSQEALRTWFSESLAIEPRLDGAVRWDGTQGDEVFRARGRIVALDAPTRMTVETTWDSAPSHEPTLLSLEVNSGHSDAAQTTVTLRHHGFDRLPAQQRAAMLDYFERFWNGDELLPLKMHVEGIGPSH